MTNEQIARYSKIVEAADDGEDFKYKTGDLVGFISALAGGRKKTNAIITAIGNGACLVAIDGVEHLALFSEISEPNGADEERLEREILQIARVVGVRYVKAQELYESGIRFEGKCCETRN